MECIRNGTKFVISLLALLALLAVSVTPVSAVFPVPVRGSQGMVSAAEPLAADIGLEILRKGGNAIDAAVAIGFAMAVTYPNAGNIGGGGFMIVHTADGQSVAIDYREKAPGRMTNSPTSSHYQRR